MLFYKAQCTLIPQTREQRLFNLTKFATISEILSDFETRRSHASEILPDYAFVKALLAAVRVIIWAFIYEMKGSISNINTRVSVYVSFSPFIHKKGLILLHSYAIIFLTQPATTALREGSLWCIAHARAPRRRCCVHSPGPGCAPYLGMSINDLRALHKLIIRYFFKILLFYYSPLFLGVILIPHPSAREANDRRHPLQASKKSLILIFEFCHSIMHKQENFLGFPHFILNLRNL